MNFVLLLETKTNTLGVTVADLAKIAAAVTIQLNRDVASIWGGEHIVRAGISNTDIQPGEYAFAILDELPDAPGDIAYHSIDGEGVPILFEAASMCDGIFSGRDSLSGAISHECIETIGDPSINRWADNFAGEEFSFELCDACESNSYLINGVTVSDFLIPSFFNVSGSVPFTFVHRGGESVTSPSVAGFPSMPFATSSGGYQRTRTSTETSTQVNGAQRRHAAKRTHWSSRSSARAAIR